MILPSSIDDNVFTKEENDFSKINSIKRLVSDSSIAFCTNKGVRFAKFKGTVDIQMIAEKQVYYEKDEVTSSFELS